MAVDPSKKKIILVVHGVQLGEDNEFDQDEVIEDLVRSRLGDTHIDFGVDLYRYENLNDAKLNKLKKLSRFIMSSPVGSILLKSIIDIAGDVVISLANNSTANTIRQKLKETILGYYNNGHPLYIVAHSLGTIYAFDIVNELISDNNYFDRNNPLEWPVQGMVTMGSPIGLPMFKATGRNNARNLGAGQFNFKWMNYYDVNDPVVSGNIFGKRLSNYKIAEAYRKGTPTQGWFIRDFPTDTGKTWLLAHTGYWNIASVGEGIVNMMV